MRRASAVLLAVGVALGIASSASAQGGVLATRICGPSACAEIANGASLFERNRLQRVSPPPLDIYYSLELSGARDRAFFLPGPGVVRVVPERTWALLDPAGAQQLIQAAEGVKPFPPPDFERVVVQDREVRDPQRYRRLFDPMPATTPPSRAARQIVIVLRTETPTPWTEGYTQLYVPSANALQRAGEWVSPPDELGDLIERDAGRGPVGSGGRPWPIVAAVAAAALPLLLGAVVLLAVRRRLQRRRA